MRIRARNTRSQRRSHQCIPTDRNSRTRNRPAAAGIGFFLRQGRGWKTRGEGKKPMTESRKNRNRVLIAEDDPVSRQMLRTFLTKWGYEVLAAEDGLEAVRLIEKEAPTLAILDWMMPGLEGPQICRRVRQTPNMPYVYILLLTARTQKEDL